MCIVVAFPGKLIPLGRVQGGLGRIGETFIRKLAVALGTRGR
jgi:hypothetical protein